MAMVFGGVAQPQPVSYLFIDGGCFQSLLRKFERDFLDRAASVLNWQAIRGNHRKVYYYDAVPVPLEGEDENEYAARIAPKLAELEGIEQQPGVHVRSGDVRKRVKRGNEQKMVDVQLTVDALSMATRGTYANATFITGDLDFKPLLDALVDMGIDVTLQFPRGETNRRLIAASDVGYPLDCAGIRQWQDPAVLPADLPETTSEPANGDSPGAAPNLTWTDPGFGNCRLWIGGGVLLLTERWPQFSTNRLRISGASFEKVCAWAMDQFGIEVPRQQAA